MKLSICMMVKNEEKNLDMCLDSLKTIMNKVSSELVIVDTGSEDNTVRIARKYTKKTYFHKWNNDFSSMRNITINYAKGEWILIIDADEFIEDCSEILVFLNSKYINEYNCCNLYVKSIMNEKENEYVVSPSPRMFRNDGYFHYEGKIHNTPVFKRPILTLNTTLIHTGYIVTDNELMNKKFERTSNILKNELEKNPDNIYYGYQLSVSYSMHKDFKEALEQIEKTYEILSKRKSEKTEYIYIYYQLAMCNLMLDSVESYQKAEKYCLEGLENEDEHIDLYFCLGKTYMFMDRYEDAIKQYLKYMDLVDNYENLRIRYNGLIEVYTISRKEEVYHDISYAYYKLCDYKNCIDYANKINGEKYLKMISRAAITAFIEETNFNGLKEFYNRILEVSEKNDILDFLSILENFILKLEKEKYKKYIDCFSEGNDTYCYLNKIRKMYEGNEYSYGNLITQFTDEFTLADQPNYFGDFIYFKMTIEEDIYNILSNVMVNKIEEFIVYITNKYKNFSEVVYNYIYKNINSNFHTVRVNRLFERFILVLDKINTEQYRDIFSDYINCGTKYIKHIYNNEILDERIIYDVKNEEDAFFIFMYKANEVKSYDEKEYLTYLRKALAVYPFMKKGIEMLLEDYKREVNSTNVEFEQYKVQVKNTIKALIENNKLDEASKIIQEYEQIVKDDLEIVLFKSEISLKKLKNVDVNYKM
ncbi:glycosyltransferase [Clostridium sp. WILCCON 0269]|uniref:Glycosyltransferase n=1 Tax=Candidatus Clostridium eludens TaxID=3381663 RepID=A0ABW8SMR7_9CLOT